MGTRYCGVARPFNLTIGQSRLTLRLWSIGSHVLHCQSQLTEGKSPFRFCNGDRSARYQWRLERERNYLTRALISHTAAEISIKETI